MRREGIPMTEPDVRFQRVELQYQTTNALFGTNELFVYDNCPKLISMIESMQRLMTIDGEVTDGIDDARYHLCACLRYAVMGLRPPKFIMERQSIKANAGSWS